MLRHIVMTHRTFNLQFALALLLAVVLGRAGLAAVNQVFVSGIYPHLAIFKNENECGTGAVVEWVIGFGYV